MALSGGTVRAALDVVGAVGGQIRNVDVLAAGADAALRQAPQGLTAAGAASFLATQAQESAYFRTTREYGTGQRYAPYIGRTFEQVTWRENYAKFGAWCRDRGLVTDPDVFVKSPVALEDYRWAWLGGVWYFQANGLWPYANRGDHYAVSQGVNRGVAAIGTDKIPLHWTQRLAMFRAFRAAGDQLLPAPAPTPAPLPQEDTMPSVPEVWSHPIDDPYTPQGGDTMPAFAALAWAAANAAKARDEAAMATRAVQDLTQALRTAGVIK